MVFPRLIDVRYEKHSIYCCPNLVLDFELIINALGEMLNSTGRTDTVHRIPTELWEDLQSLLYVERGLHRAIGKEGHF